MEKPLFFLHILFLNAKHISQNQEVFSPPFRNHPKNVESSMDVLRPVPSSDVNV